MAMGLRVKKILDGKKCFEAWSKTGSVYLAPAYLAKEYGIYGVTGKPVSHQGVWLASNEYIINNLVDAKATFDESMRSNGRMPTDKDWYNFVVPKIKKLGKKKFEKYMENHQWLKPYMGVSTNG